MAASRAVSLATLASTSKIAPEVGQAGIQVAERITDGSGDHPDLTWS